VVLLLERVPPEGCHVEADVLRGEGPVQGLVRRGGIVAARPEYERDLPVVDDFGLGAHSQAEPAAVPVGPALHVDVLVAEAEVALELPPGEPLQDALVEGVLLALLHLVEALREPLDLSA
jgi:hypothetical protein